MQSGKQTLATIDKNLQRIRKEVLSVDGRVKEASESLVSLQKEQTERFRRMAEIRLDNVISGELSGSLEAADKHAGEIIRQRGQKLAALTRKAKRLAKQQLDYEQQREAAAEGIASATEALDSAEAVTQARLEKDPEYQAQLKKSRQTELTAEHAMEKTRQARSVRAEKGGPYENDPLFSYLWKRGYGTSAYSGSALTRWLDDWVAGLCGYDAARPNYASLLEIPERLDEHAQRLREVADDEFIKLTAIEVREGEEDGLPALRDAVAEAQARQDEIDQQIEALEDEMRALEHERSRFASGEDEDFQQAIRTLRQALERENLYTLFEYARATATPEDDLLVQEMDEARSRVREAGDFLADRKRARERLAERMEELENVRRKFKRKRFDSVHSEFRNEKLLDITLEQFLVGTATAKELWRAIERGQHYRRIQANPAFGTGGFRRRPGTWHTPFPRGGAWGGGLGGGLGGGFGGGRGGGFGGGLGGGGGFRTGGGF